MRVYVIRHAAAADRGDYPSDGARPLVAKGIDSMKVMGNALMRLGAAPEKIFTSPLVRASQTARIVVKALGGRIALVECQELQPGRPAADVLALLARERIEETVIVGHEPQLGGVVSLMVAGCDRPLVDMKKGSVACVEFDGPAKAGRGVLAWHMVPSVAEALLGKHGGRVKGTAGK